MWQRLTLVVLTIFTAPLAYGHDSGNPYADWFTSLKQPHDPTTSCCGVADQYYVKDYRPSQQPGMAFIAKVINNKRGVPDFEIEVPQHTIIRNQHNPTDAVSSLSSIRAALDNTDTSSALYREQVSEWRLSTISEFTLDTPTNRPGNPPPEPAAIKVTI
jgi:hypothetical protein